MIATRGVPRAVVACGIAGVLVIVLAVVVVVGLIIWPLARSSAGHPPPAPKQVSRPATTAALVRPALDRESAPAELAPPPAVPASLEGSDADGAVTADASGHLVIDLELRRLYDHFLAASGEEPIATMRARIIAVLRARLPATAAAEGIAILDRYLGYREAARQLVATGSPRDGLARVHDLRVQQLSPVVAAAFFADEEAATLTALARRDALADPALTAAERDRRLAEIDRETPSAVLEARAAALAPVTELAQETAMRAAGAGDDQIAAMRTAQLGPEAAARLAELDRAHATWDSRLAADSRLDDAERTRRLDELAAQSFSPAERVRVETLDRIATAHATPAARSTSGNAGASGAR